MPTPFPKLKQTPCECYPRQRFTLEKVRQVDLRIIRRGNAGRRSFQVDSFDSRADLSALSDQVAKVLPSDLAFGLYFARFLALLLQVLDVALKALAQFVGGVFERAAHLGGDASGVGMCVVQGLELSRKLG